jgi:hypothetical protein
MPTERTSSPGPLELTRRILKGVVASFVPVLFAGFFLSNVEEGMSFGASVVALGQRLLMVALGSAVAAAAGAFGMRLLRTFGCAAEGLLARFVAGAGVGLGALALITLGLGCLGLLGPPAAAVVLGAFLLLGARELPAFGRFLRDKAGPRLQPLSHFELLLLLLSLTVLLFSLMLAFSLPRDYDACEYHMAAPATWFQSGRIHYMPGNVYSNLPMNCEMLYLFSMGLCGEPMLGIHLAVVMNSLVSVLAGGAVYVTARRFLSRRSALGAATLFFTTPAVLASSTVNIYNETALAFYATLSIHAFLEFSGTRALRWAAVSAVFAGLAGGVKFTALAFFPAVLGVSCVFAFPARRRAEAAPLHGTSAPAGLLRRIGAGALYVAVALATVSPWLAKSLAFTGNPTYPFFYRVFGGRDWSSELDEKWYAGQFEAADTAASGNIFQAAWRRVLMEEFGSPALLVFLLLSLAALREPRVRWLLAFLVLWTLFWYFFTHRVGRFWYPMLGPAAVLAGRGLEVFHRKRLSALAPIVLAALVAASGWQTFLDSMLLAQCAFNNYDLKTGNDRFLGSRDGYGLYPLVVFARTLEPAQRLCLVGEAQTLYLPLNVSCSTVFNHEVFTSTVRDVHDPVLVRENLRRALITHLFVNWAEIGRLRRTYTYVDADGTTHPGFPPLTPGDFTRLVEAGVLTELEEWRFGPRGEVPGLTAEDLASLPGGKPCIFYAVNREPAPHPRGLASAGSERRNSAR